MASYEDEHDCAQDEVPTLLTQARFLIDYGFTADFQSLFQSSRHPPPASPESVEALQTLLVTPQLTDKQCPVCLKEFEIGRQVKQLPCKHHFHADCILKWLNQTCSCPVCRFELPTDDPEYENHKKEKKREKEREEEIKSLHDSMFT